MGFKHPLRQYKGSQVYTFIISYISQFDYRIQTPKKREMVESISK